MTNATPLDPQAEFNRWKSPPATADRQWYQARGRALERIIDACLAGEDLSPRTSYRPKGEEVDGSFELNHRVYLLEAKWKKTTLPASDLYAFKGKVDGKLTGTIGVVIAMSGYSADAIDALIAGKIVNLVLFTGADFQQVLDKEMTFAEAMGRKLRYAAEQGLPYLPLKAQRVQARRPSYQQFWDFVVENGSYALAMRRLIEQLGPATGQAVSIWDAGGRSNVAGLVRWLEEQGRTNVAAFLDAEAPSPDAFWELQQVIAEEDGRLILFEPNLKELLLNTAAGIDTSLKQAVATGASPISEIAGYASAKRLAQTNAKLYSLLSQALNL